MQRVAALVGLLLMALSSVAIAQGGAWPWTGLVYSRNAPPDGTAERVLFDGKNFLRSEMPATAKDVLIRAIRMDPTLAEAYFWLAGAQRALGEGVAARRSLSTALRLDPSLAAHVGELDRFGPATLSSPARQPAARGGSCDALYTTCMVGATRCTMNGCATDFGRQATCTGERNQCERRNH